MSENPTAQHAQNYIVLYAWSHNATNAGERDVKIIFLKLIFYSFSITNQISKRKTIRRPV
jgi:hypothetical protein